ncbi:hypothetical protein ABZ691_23650 [Streptomyces sp. NPDC006854]|uniref:hypothetical protein n=1 Tax=Streptomyces sp. NPDC006854 TaxID=3155115 RepID=UPI0033EBC1C5
MADGRLVSHFEESASTMWTPLMRWQRQRDQPSEAGEYGYMDRVSQVNLKFDRSRHHVAQLTDAIRDYLDREPFAVYEEEEPEGNLVYRVRVGEPPPAELSLMLGDAIHNARSALDYLAWQLVEASGGTPSSSNSTMFPIAKSERDFIKAYPERLKGASAEAITAVRSLRPFSGGDERFWRLHRLDIADKHHLLVTVGLASPSVNVSLGLPDGPRMVLPILPADRACLLEDGAAVFRVMKAARESASQGMGGPDSFSFDVAFGEGAIVSGKPIVPTLPDIIEGVRNAVTPIYRLLA